MPGCFLCCTESVVSKTVLVPSNLSPYSRPFEEDEQLPSDNRAATTSYLPAMHWRMVCRPRWACVWECSREIEACQESCRMSSQSKWPTVTVRRSDTRLPRVLSLSLSLSLSFSLSSSLLSSVSDSAEPRRRASHDTLETEPIGSEAHVGGSRGERLHRDTCHLSRGLHRALDRRGSEPPRRIGLWHSCRQGHLDASKVTGRSFRSS